MPAAERLPDDPAQSPDPVDTPALVDLFFRIREIGTRPENWNGQGARAVRPATVDLAFGLLAMTCAMGLAPAVVCADVEGGITLDWHSNEKLEGGGSCGYASISVDNDQDYVLLIVDRVTDQITARELLPTTEALAAAVHEAVRAIQSPREEHIMGPLRPLMPRGTSRAATMYMWHLEMKLWGLRRTLRDACRLLARHLPAQNGATRAGEWQVLKWNEGAYAGLEDPQPRIDERGLPLFRLSSQGADEVCRLFSGDLLCVSRLRDLD